MHSGTRQMSLHTVSVIRVSGQISGLCRDGSGFMSPAPVTAFADSGDSGLQVTDSCVPVIAHTARLPPKRFRDTNSQKRETHRSAAKREPALYKDSFFEIHHHGTDHIISENYSYKTEPYYSILRHELEGKVVQPSSSAVLDAYVVPICLERARLAGIPVCEWGISQGYVPLPSIIYGLNYFADTSEYCIVNNEVQAKEAVRHITNMGKYPFCYQKLPDDATISTCISVFGKTAGKCKNIEHLARGVYDHFAIPLVTMVTVSVGTEHHLSSLSPTRYTQLSTDERALLLAYLNHQEFL
jgi:hypothetical protein